MRAFRRPAPLFADTLRIDGPSSAAFLLGIAIFSLITFLRWPEILTHPTFWGEDGWFWWPEARKFGLGSLFMPHTGYFQTDSRLIGLLAAPFPLKDGPLIFALAAFIFQIMPPAYFLSSRCAALCPSTALRFMIGAILCAMPNTWEVYANLTNSQWHLAILSCLIIMASSPRTTMAWVFDLSMLIVGSFSGPFSILLAPVAIWITWCNFDKARIIRLSVVLIGACLQIYSILHLARGVPPYLGATPTAMARLIGGQIVGASLLGHRHLEQIYSLSLWKDNVLPWIITIVALWLVCVASYRFVALRIYGFFAITVFSASMACPVSTGTIPTWTAFTAMDFGGRYFYIIITFWLVTIISLAFAGERGNARLVARILLTICLCIGIPRDWRMNPFSDAEFLIQAEKFETAPVGTHMILPERPGAPFEVTK